MWTLFEIFINFVQAILILVFMKGRLHITRKHKLSDIFCVTCITLYTTAYLIWNIPLSDACVFIIPLIYALYIADDPWYVSAFWTSILTLLFLSVISLSLHIFMTIPHISYEKLMEISIGRLLFVLVTNIMLALVVFLISKMKKDYSAPYWPVLLLFLATNMALFMVEEALYALQMSVELHGMVSTHTLFFAYIGLCACTVLTIFLFHIMSQSVERENQYRAEAFTVAHTKQYQQELEQLYTRLRTAKHDMKQHYQVLEEMVSQGNNAEAKEYFVTCQQNAEKDDFYLTGSTAVDALLLAKSLTMKKSEFFFDTHPIRWIKFPSTNQTSVPLLEICWIMLLRDLYE